MLEAVLFDWGDTLARWEWSDELHDAGHEAGFRAIGRQPDRERTLEFRAELLPLVEERDYRELMRDWLAPVTIPGLKGLRVWQVRKDMIAREAA